MWPGRHAIRLCLALAALACGGAGGAAAELKSSLTAKLSLFDAATGKPLERPQHGEPVRLQVVLTDATTGRPPRGMNLLGWVQPVERGAPRCEEAVRAFRSTRKLPVGAVDLNGVQLVSLATDGSLGVIDPRLSFNSSNMTAAAKLPALPSLMAVDAEAARALVSYPGESAIGQVSLVSGGASSFADPGFEPSDIAAIPGGRVWVASKNSPDIVSYDSRGKVAVRRELAPGASLRHVETAAGGLVAAFAPSGKAAVFHALTGDVVAQFDLGRPIMDASFVADTGFLFVTQGSGRISLRYLDDPDTAVEIDAGFEPGSVRVGRDGAQAIAFTRGQPLVAVIDIATARLVQAAELSGATVADATLTGNAGFLVSADGGFVAVFERASVKAGTALQLRHVPLRGQTGGWTVEDGAELLVTMAGAGEVLVVDPEYQTAWSIPEKAAVAEMPPMDSTRIRGGMPYRVKSADRSFRQVRDGVFETVAAFQPGSMELVLATTGIGGLVSCIRFDVEGPREVLRTRIYSVSLQPADGVFNPGVEEEVVVHLHDAEGTPLRANRMTFDVPSLNTSWRGRLVVTAGQDGALRGTISLPHPGVFAVVPVGVPPTWQTTHALTLKVSE